MLGCYEHRRAAKIACESFTRTQIAEHLNMSEMGQELSSHFSGWRSHGDALILRFFLSRTLLQSRLLTFRLETGREWTECSGVGGGTTTFLSLLL